MFDENNNKTLKTRNLSQNNDSSFKLPKKRKKKTDYKTLKKVKRPRLKSIGLKDENASKLPSKVGLFSMPLEIHHQIMSYLKLKDLIYLRRASKYFEDIVPTDKSVKYYKILQNGSLILSTNEVINDLSRMPCLTDIFIYSRTDLNEILKQIKISNKNLEKLHIGGPLDQSLDNLSNNLKVSRKMLQILEECPKLHSLDVRYFSFRNRKVYQKLGEISSQLRSMHLKLRHCDYETFVKHMDHLNPMGRAKLLNLSWLEPKRRSSRLRFNVLQPNFLERLVRIEYSYSQHNYRKGRTGLKNRYRWCYLLKSDFKNSEVQRYISSDSIFNVQ